MINRYLLLAVCCLFKLSGIQAQDKAKAPHIILLMTDQHRWDAIGKMNPSVITPTLDQLAEDGVWFSNAYSTTPSCTPARSGLLTGLSPWHHGMLGYSGKGGIQYKYEMPKMMREAGYYTCGIGKMHWYPQRNKHGFHEMYLDESGREHDPGFKSEYRKWFASESPGQDPDITGIGWNEHAADTYKIAEDLHPTAWTGYKAADFIDNYDKQQPMFLKVSFARPHSPYDPPKRYLDMYEDVEVPLPYAGDWAEEFRGYEMTKDAAFGDFGEEYAVRSRRHYLANVTFIDDQIARVIDALKEKGMYENALIIFISDHGDMLGDHHHWRKTYAYEGSAAIPFIVKLPEGQEKVTRMGEEMYQPVELRDVLPTFLDAAGVAVPEDMDGASVLNLVEDKHADWRPYIDLEHAKAYREKNYWTGLTDGNWKYIFFALDGSEQLFDLQNDPGEERDLAGLKEYQNELKKWRKRMGEHLEERGKPYVKRGMPAKRPNILFSPMMPSMDYGEYEAFIEKQQ